MDRGMVARGKEWKERAEEGLSEDGLEHGFKRAREGGKLQGMYADDGTGQVNN